MILDLRPYPAYKDSGLPWLPSIPDHWESPRIKVLLKEFEHRTATGQGSLLSLRMREGLVDHIAAGGKDIPPEALVGYKLIEPGVVVMNRMRAASGLFGVARSDGLVSPDYATFCPALGINTAYLMYLFKIPLLAQIFRAESKGLGTGEAGFLRLYTDRFGTIHVPQPSTNEQTAIVRFLDYIDQMIRHYIRAKQKLVKLLEEQQRAIIRRAITQPDMPNRKASPLVAEWPHAVPDHWEVTALKWVLTKLIDCEHKTAPAVDSSDYRVVRTTAIRNGALNLSGTYCTTEAAFNDWTRRGVPQHGDVMFTREAPAGEACIVPAGQKLCLGQRTVLMKVDRTIYDPRFLIHMIYAGPPSTRIRLASQGSTVGHFNMDDIGSMYILMPPLQEQREIVAKIEAETRIAILTAHAAEREIRLLREYRTRLVSDVVTGQLDVREAAASLPDELDEPDELSLTGEILDVADEADLEMDELAEEVAE